MSAWKRWQDWAIVILGIVLFITPLTVPFISGGTATAPAAYTAYVMGVLFVGLALYMLANPAKLLGEWIEMVLGVLLIASPFAVGFSGVVVVAYTAWIIGVLAILLAGSVLLIHRRRPAMAH
jgi:SPW repeat